MDAKELLEKYAAGERNFAGADLAGAKLAGADLARANAAQLHLPGRYSVAIVGDFVAVGCECHTHAEWAECWQAFAADHDLTDDDVDFYKAAVAILDGLAGREVGADDA
jgi:uncharacterized protein YjbI with pentapeptide repeats